MAQARDLRIADVQRVYRLLGEVRELGDDPGAWRRHMLAELNGLTAAAVAMGGEFGPGPLVPPVGVVDLGWSRPADRANYWAYLKQGKYASDEVAIRMADWRTE